MVNGSVHDIDGVDMWPAITGANASSPRPWLPTTETSILWQQSDGAILKFISQALPVNHTLIWILPVP